MTLTTHRRPHTPTRPEAERVQITLSRETARAMIRYAMISARLAAGRSQTACALAIGLKKQSQYAMLETARVPELDKLVQLMRFLDAEDRIPVLTDVLRIARSPEQGGEHPVQLISHAQLFLGFELVTRSMDVHSPYVFPSLLQTKNYARAIILPSTAHRPEFDPERALVLRLGRSEVLWRVDNPMRLDAYVGENALLPTVTSVPVLLEQLHHTVRLIDQLPNVHVRIAPGLVTTGELNVLRFTDKWRLIYGETPVSGHFYDTPDEIEHATRMMGGLSTSALSREESRARIVGAIEKLEAA